MPVLIVMKILLVGALVGGFAMFWIFRQQTERADGKPVSTTTSFLMFLVRLAIVAVVALLAFWFVTRF